MCEKCPSPCRRCGSATCNDPDSKGCSDNILGSKDDALASLRVRAERMEKERDFYKESVDKLSADNLKLIQIAMDCRALTEAVKCDMLQHSDCDHHKVTEAIAFCEKSFAALDALEAGEDS